jgi:translation initiation factor IF-2
VAKLAIVLKSDSMGSEEALFSSIKRLQVKGAEIEVIHSGIGPVSKSDLFMALAGTKLVVGFSVGILPKIEPLSKEMGVEIRLYETIYKLIEDLRTLCSRLVSSGSEEKITGRAVVIALFKSSRKAIILGCKVQEGNLSVGKSFRLISDPGEVYRGKVSSLHIEKDVVDEAKAGQQVGLKISDFNRAKIGDIVECFQEGTSDRQKAWQPRGGVYHL